MITTDLASFDDLPGPYWFLLAPPPQENRLTQVVGEAVTTYRYNGDGQRVTLTTGCTTTTYIGNYFEWAGSAAASTSYYYAGGTRIAMRTGTPLTGTVSYLLGDHLGSSSVSYRVGDGQTVTQRYYPWGTLRPGPDNALPTDYTFTGQKLDASAGLMYYGARYYDSTLGRFLSADTIVSQPGNPQSLNRYSYASNNPVRYVDPNGHCGPLTPVCLGLLLGGLLFLLQGDVQTHPPTQAEIASQRLGGALFVAGAGLTVGAGAAGLGPQAATAACADGDCTNEVRGAGQVIQNTAKAAESSVTLRQQYESAVRALSDKGANMRSAGKSAEEIARSLSAERRALGEQFKAMTPPDALEQIYARNLERYGDKLGPTVDWLVEQGLRQGKSMEQIWESIIEKASRPGGGDIIPKLLNK